MAQQKGIIPSRGTIGNITFYKSGDGYLASERGGIDASRIATDPAFATAAINLTNTVAANSTLPLFLALGIEFYRR